MVGDRASPGAVLELLGPNLPSRLCVRVLTCMKDAEASRLEDAEPQDGHHSHCAAGKRAGGPGRGGGTSDHTFCCLQCCQRAAPAWCSPADRCLLPATPPDCITAFRVARCCLANSKEPKRRPLSCDASSLNDLTLGDGDDR